MCIRDRSDHALFQVNTLNEGTLDNSCTEMKAIFNKKKVLAKQIAELDSYLTLDINDKELQRIYKKIKQAEEKIIQDKVVISDLEQKHAQATSKLNSATSEFNKYVEAYLATAELRDSVDRTVKSVSYTHLHLIRWFYTMLELRKTEREIVLPIKRADNTLKGTIKQLIDMPEVQNMPNKNLYKKLASASTTMPEIELKNTIYYTFVNLIESDDGKASEDTERMINRVNRQHLVALLQNSLFKERLMLEDGPIERIYCKFAENKTTEVNDKAAEFISADFELDSDVYKRQDTDFVNIDF